MELYNDAICVESSIKYEKTDVNELDKNRILCQIQKTGNTIFNIKEINFQVENLKLPISKINQLRREAIERFEMALEQSIQRKYDKEICVELETKGETKETKETKPKVNLYLQKYDDKIDYESLDYHEIYVPFQDLIDQKQMRDCIAVLPNIMDENYEKLISRNLAVFKNVKGVMISHLSQVEFLKKWGITKKIVGNDSLNITNQVSEKVLKDLEIERFTLSPELDKKQMNEFSSCLEKELVVYGRVCLMTSKYCPIGKNENCHQICRQGNYELKDRKDLKFPVVAD